MISVGFRMIKLLSVVYGELTKLCDFPDDFVEIDLGRIECDSKLLRLED